MGTKRWCGLLFVIPYVLGDTFRIAVADHIVKKSPNHEHKYDGSQSHLDTLSPYAELNSKQGRLEDVALIAYGVNVSIGTPPQTVKVLLDNNFPFLFVQSSDCDSSLCNSYGHAGFNSSASSSYRDGGPSILEFNYANVAFEGIKAKELVAVAGVKLDGQDFESVVTARPRTFFHWYFDYNGVLGLGRLPPEHALNSPWQSMTDRGLLTKNVLSFVLPQGTRDLDLPRSNGELIIGDYPPNFRNEDYIRLPLLAPETPRRGGGWSWLTKLHTLTYRNHSSTLHHEAFGKSAAAYFSTALPYIQLPRPWVRLIMSSIGPTEHSGFFESFPCERRDNLPNLVFGLGDQNITLNAYQYTFELKSSKRKTHDCVIALETAGIETVDDASDVVIGLGWPFLENFDVVFHQDEDAVFLKHRAH